MPQHLCEYQVLYTNAVGGAFWEWITEHAVEAALQDREGTAWVRLRVPKTTSTTRRLLRTALAGSGTNDGHDLDVAVDEIDNVSFFDHCQVTRAMSAGAGTTHLMGTWCAPVTYDEPALPPYTDALGAAMVGQAIGRCATLLALHVVREDVIVPEVRTELDGGSRMDGLWHAVPTDKTVDTIVRITSSHDAADILRSPSRSAGYCVAPGDTVTKVVAMNHLVSGVVFEAADGTRLPATISFDATTWFDCVDGTLDMGTFLDWLQRVRSAASAFELMATGGTQDHLTSVEKGKHVLCNGEGAPASRPVLNMSRLNCLLVRPLSSAPIATLRITHYNIIMRRDHTNTVTGHPHSLYHTKWGF